MCRGGGSLSESSCLGGRAEQFREVERPVPATVQYDLWKNVLARGEIRWDHQAGQLGAGFNGPAYGGTSASGSGTLYNSYEMLANIVYKF